MGDYDGLKVVELKKELDSRGLSKTGRKADLIKRLVADDKANARSKSPTPKKAAKPKQSARRTASPAPSRSRSRSPAPKTASSPVAEVLSSPIKTARQFVEQALSPARASKGRSSKVAKVDQVAFNLLGIGLFMHGAALLPQLIDQYTSGSFQDSAFLVLLLQFFVRVAAALDLRNQPKGLYFAAMLSCFASVFLMVKKAEADGTTLTARDLAVDGGFAVWMTFGIPYFLEF